MLDDDKPFFYLTIWLASIVGMAVIVMLALIFVEQR